MPLRASLVKMAAAAAMFLSATPAFASDPRQAYPYLLAGWYLIGTIVVVATWLATRKRKEPRLRAIARSVITALALSPGGTAYTFVPASGAFLSIIAILRRHDPRFYDDRLYLIAWGSLNLAIILAVGYLVYRWQMRVPPRVTQADTQDKNAG